MSIISLQNGIFDLEEEAAGYDFEGTEKLLS